MYHYIYPSGKPAPEYWSSTYEQLEAQMQWFHDNGFSTITADELYVFITTGVIKNPRSFLPIFDDNWYESVKNRVIPILSKYGFVPTLALYTDGIYESGRGTVFTWDELKEWQDAGIVDVQSHSVTHPLRPTITQLSESALWHELYDSKLELEQHLGKEIIGFVTPGGAYDERVLDAARRAGYRTFMLLAEKGGIAAGDNPFLIYRVNMVNTLDFDTFVGKIKHYTGIP